MTHDCDLTIFLFHWFLKQVVLFLFTILSKLKKIYILVNFMLTAQMDNPGSADKTDWKLCVICQQSIKEKLRCPAQSKRQDKEAGYKTLGEHLKQFAEIDCLPDISLSRLDEGDGILATLSRHKASFHKTCYDRFNSTQLKRAQKRRSEAQENLGAGGKFTRSNAASYTKESPASCFICESEKGPFHEVSTMELDARVRECATLLNDEKLLAKLGGGDLIALEARYHGTCLTMLYRRAEYARRENIPEEEKPQRLEGIAMAEVVTFIEESRKTGAELPTFRLADLAKIYTSALEQLGMKTTAKLNTYHLKERIVHRVPSLEYFNKGRDVYLVFREDVGNVLQKT